MLDLTADDGGSGEGLQPAGTASAPASAPIPAPAPSAPLAAARAIPEVLHLPALPPDDQQPLQRWDVVGGLLAVLQASGAGEQHIAGELSC